MRYAFINQLDAVLRASFVEICLLKVYPCFACGLRFASTTKYVRKQLLY